MIAEQDHKKLLSLKTDLQAQKREAALEKAQQIRLNSQYQTERNGKVSTVWVVEANAKRVVLKEDLSRKDSQTISLEKFLKYFEPVAK